MTITIMLYGLINTVCLASNNTLGLGTHLFVKVPRPGDSEVTFSVFESSFRFSTLHFAKIENLLIFCNFLGKMI